MTPFWNPLIKGFEIMYKSNSFNKVSVLANLSSLDDFNLITFLDEFNDNNIATFKIYEYVEVHRGCVLFVLRPRKDYMLRHQQLTSANTFLWQIKKVYINMLLPGLKLLLSAAEEYCYVVVLEF